MKIGFLIRNNWHFYNMFDQFYQQSSDHLKLKFLEESFRKYPDLKEDFLAFYLKPADNQLKMTITEEEDFILASTDIIKEELEEINLIEPDWEYYVPRHSGYIPEYEAREHMAEDSIDRLIGIHVSEVERYFAEKQFELAFLYMISLYQACMQAELDDEYETLPDPIATMLNSLEQHLVQNAHLFKAIQLSDDQIYTITKIIFDYGHKNGSDPTEFLTFFEGFLNSVTQTGSQAKIVLDIIEKEKAEDYIPWLVTEMHKKSGGFSAWEKSALQVYKKNISVARELLEHYLKQDKAKFVSTVRSLWNEGLYQHEFAGFYFEEMKAEEDPELYRKVILFLLDKNFSMEYYQVLQKLMSKEERLRFIEKFQRNRVGYVEALCMEDKTTEALQFATQYIDRWNLVDIMSPCFQKQPQAALSLFERKIETLLVDERGRDFYEQIAKLLTLASKIPEIKPDAEQLAAKLYSKFSRMPALKQELRSTGLIK